MLPSFFAWFHHLCAFAIVSALVTEHVLLMEPLTLSSAQRLLSVDRIYGIAAALILLVGFSRVFYFEKGSDYYFHNAPYVAKMSLFIVVGLVSIIPTVEFLSWRKGLRQGKLPKLSEKRYRLLTICVRIELTCIVFMLLCAAMMAKGVGFMHPAGGL
jgi:putative membrane protein